MDYDKVDKLVVFRLQFRIRKELDSLMRWKKKSLGGLVWTLEWIMKFHVGNSHSGFCARAWGCACEFGGGRHLVWGIW